MYLLGVGIQQWGVAIIQKEIQNSMRSQINEHRNILDNEFSSTQNLETECLADLDLQKLANIPQAVLSGVLIDILSPSTGMVNSVLKALGLQPVFFLADDRIFPFVLVATDIWKEFGFSTIIYLAALTGVGPTLYEAAIVDGANRWQQTWHVTLPSILYIIILMGVLSLGNILNAGFDQVFNLYSPVVYKTGDIIDTMVYRLGIIGAQYGPATAVGLFKSVVSLVFIAGSYSLAYKYGDYRVF